MGASDTFIGSYEYRQWCRQLMPSYQREYIRFSNASLSWLKVKRLNRSGYLHIRCGFVVSVVVAVSLGTTNVWTSLSVRRQISWLDVSISGDAYPVLTNAYSLTIVP